MRTAEEHWRDFCDAVGIPKPVSPIARIVYLSGIGTLALELLHSGMPMVPEMFDLLTVFVADIRREIAKDGAE